MPGKFHLRPRFCTRVLRVVGLQVPELLGFAALSDRIGRRKVYLAGALDAGVWVFPAFLLGGVPLGAGRRTFLARAGTTRIPTPVAGTRTFA